MSSPIAPILLLVVAVAGGCAATADLPGATSGSAPSTATASSTSSSTSSSSGSTTSTSPGTGCGGLGPTTGTTSSGGAAPVLSGPSQFQAQSAALVYGEDEDGSEYATLTISSAAIGCGATPAPSAFTQLEVLVHTGQALLDGTDSVGLGTSSWASLSEIDGGVTESSVLADHGSITFVAMGNGGGSGVFDFFFAERSGGFNELSGNFSGNYCP